MLEHMGRVDTTMPSIGTAHRVFGLLSLFAPLANMDVAADLKRFVRLFIFLSTVALSVVFGFRAAGFLGSAIAFVLILVNWTAFCACMIAKDPEA